MSVSRRRPDRVRFDRPAFVGPRPGGRRDYRGRWRRQQDHGHHGGEVGGGRRARHLRADQGDYDDSPRLPFAPCAGRAAFARRGPHRLPPTVLQARGPEAEPLVFRRDWTATWIATWTASTGRLRLVAIARARLRRAAVLESMMDDYGRPSDHRPRGARRSNGIQSAPATDCHRMWRGWPRGRRRNKAIEPAEDEAAVRAMLPGVLPHLRSCGVAEATGTAPPPPARHPGRGGPPAVSQAARAGSPFRRRWYPGSLGRRSSEQLASELI